MKAPKEIGASPRQDPLGKSISVSKVTVTKPQRLKLSGIKMGKFGDSASAKAKAAGILKKRLMMAAKQRVARKRMAEAAAAPQTVSRSGQIAYTDAHGLYVVVEPGTNHEYVFTLNKVKSYDGSDPKSFGLRKGATVRFESDRDKIVTVIPPILD